MNQDIGHIKHAGRGESRYVGGIHHQDDEANSDPFRQFVFHIISPLQSRARQRAVRPIADAAIATPAVSYTVPASNYPGIVRARNTDTATSRETAVAERIANKPY